MPSSDPQRDDAPPGSAPVGESWPLVPAAGGTPAEAVLPAVVTSLPNAWSLLQALRRRWLLALVVGVLGSVAASAATWFLLPPPAHTVRAQLYVSSQRPMVLFRTSEAQSDFHSFRQTQIALIKSRLVLNAALRQPKVAELAAVRQEADPIGWLEKELKVSGAASPEILTVVMQGGDAAELKVIVDAVVAAYLQEIVNKEHGKRQARLDQLKEIAAKYDENLRRKRRTLRELAESVGSGDKQQLALRQLYNQEQYHLTQRELLQVRSELRKLQVQAGAAEEGEEPEVEVPAAAVEAAIDRDPLLTRYLAEQNRYAEYAEQARRNAAQGEKHPSVQRYRRLADELSTRIRKRREELRDQVEKQLREKAQFLSQSEGSAGRKRVAFYQRLEKQLTHDLERLEKELRSLNKGSLDLGSIQGEIAQAEEVARRVGDEVEKLSVELQAPAQIQVLEDAVIDTADARSRHIRMVGLAGAAVLVLSLGGIAWLEFRSRRIDSVEQVVNGLGMKLVGTVPAQPSGLNRFTRTKARGERWQSALHESVNAAREMLLHVARAESVRVVMVTSAVAGEGKTSLATQLAGSLARAGRKTLLIDCDLRNPAAHRVFELPHAPGVSEILRDEIDPADTILETSIHGLSLLPAGHWDNEAMIALAKGNLEALFERMRQRFDFVVVDSSPVLPVADAVQVGQHVDGVVFSVLRNVSQLPRVYSATQRLTGLGIRLLGAVVLGTREDVGSYGYNYVAPRRARTTQIIR